MKLSHLPDTPTGSIQIAKFMRQTWGLHWFDWLIIFIKSFLTQHNKIQHMVKYTVTVLVTKQQAKKRILVIAKMHKIHPFGKSVNISPWYHKIYWYLKVDDICIYIHMYTCIYTGDIYIPHSIYDIKPIKAKEGSRGGRSPFYRSIGNCCATMECGAVNAATLVLSIRS